MAPVIPQIQFCLAGHPERRLAGIALQVTMVPMWVGPCFYVFNNVFWSLFFDPPPVVLALVAATARLQPSQSNWAIAAGIVAIAASAWLLAITVDLPVNRLRGRKLAQRRRAA